MAKKQVHPGYRSFGGPPAHSTFMQNLRTTKTIINKADKLEDTSYTVDDYKNVMHPEAERGALTSYHIDHKKPISKGGTTTPNNLNAIHSQANYVKGASTSIVSDNMQTGLEQDQFSALKLHIETLDVDVCKALGKLLLKAPPKDFAWKAFNTQFQYFVEEALPDATGESGNWSNAKYDGPKIYEFISSFMGEGRRTNTSFTKKKEVKAAQFHKATRDPWSERETELFKSAMEKHGQKWRAIMKDTSAGSFGLQNKNRRTNVNLKDKYRTLERPAQKKPYTNKGTWDEAEVKSFLEAVDKHRQLILSPPGRGKPGIWATIKSDTTIGCYSTKYPGRKVQQLREKHRNLVQNNLAQPISRRAESVEIGPNKRRKLR